MAAKLSMLIEIDIPTAVQEELDAKVEASGFVRGYSIGTARHFVKQYPCLYQWMARNGYMELDMMMTVGKKDEEVDQPVEQPAPM